MGRASAVGGTESCEMQLPSHGHEMSGPAALQMLRPGAKPDPGHRKGRGQVVNVPALRLVSPEMSAHPCRKSARAEGRADIDMPASGQMAGAQAAGSEPMGGVKPDHQGIGAANRGESGQCHQVPGRVARSFLASDTRVWARSLEAYSLADAMEMPAMVCCTRGRNWGSTLRVVMPAPIKKGI